MFALSLHRGWTRLAPDIELVAAPIRLDAPAPDVPAGATVFVLVGPRWLRSKPGDPSFLAKASDPMRRLLEASLKGGHRIVPVLFEVSLTEWGKMCREFPPTLENLGPAQRRRASIAIILAGPSTPDSLAPVADP